MNPEHYQYLMEKLFNQGALDVYLTPIQMKKNRPAVKLNVLTGEKNLEALMDIIFRESTSLGIRVLDITRYSLERTIQQVETPWGMVDVKVARRGEQIFNIAPEYEICKQIAQESNLPLKRVYQYIQKQIDSLFN